MINTNLNLNLLMSSMERSPNLNIEKPLSEQDKITKEISKMRDFVISRIKNRIKNLMNNPTLKKRYEELELKCKEDKEKFMKKSKRLIKNLKNLFPNNKISSEDFNSFRESFCDNLFTSAKSYAFLLSMYESIKEEESKAEIYSLDPDKWSSFILKLQKEELIDDEVNQIMNTMNTQKDLQNQIQELKEASFIQYLTHQELISENGNELDSNLKTYLKRFQEKQQMEQWLKIRKYHIKLKSSSETEDIKRMFLFFIKRYEEGSNRTSDIFKNDIFKNDISSEALGLTFFIIKMQQKMDYNAIKEQFIEFMKFEMKFLKIFKSEVRSRNEEYHTLINNLTIYLEMMVSIKHYKKLVQDEEDPTTIFRIKGILLLENLITGKESNEEIIQIFKKEAKEKLQTKEEKKQKTISVLLQMSSSENLAKENNYINKFISILKELDQA